MAHFRKLPSGLWRAEIERRGVRKSQSFATKAAAVQWATQQEAAILDGKASRWPRKTVADALDRYEVEVSAKKRTHEAEWKRMNALRRHYPDLCAKVISEVTTADLAAWRDDRLSKVTGGSVQRDINLLRHLWNVSRDEWQWHDQDPWKALKLPGNNMARDRLIRWWEIRRFLRRCNYKAGVRPVTGTELTGWAFLVALRTAMRAGEVLSLTGQSVDLDRRVVTLTQHKTMEKVGTRKVPLTPQAVRLLRVIYRPGPLLPIPARTLDAMFRKLRKQCLLDDIHFHDSRATALSHLSKRLDPMELARVSGHRDLSLLMNVYYRTTAEDIAEKMAMRQAQGAPAARAMR